MADNSCCFCCLVGWLVGWLLGWLADNWLPLVIHMQICIYIYIYMCVSWICHDNQSGILKKLFALDLSIVTILFPYFLLNLTFEYELVFYEKCLLHNVYNYIINYIQVRIHSL